LLLLFFILGVLLVATFIFYTLWHYLLSVPTKIVFLIIEKDVQNIEWLMRQVLHSGRLKLVVVDRVGGEGSVILEKLSRSYDFVMIDFLPASAEDVFYINAHTSMPILKEQLKAVAKGGESRRQKDNSGNG